MKIALVTDRFNTGGGLEHLYQTAKGMPDVDFIIFGKAGDAHRKFSNLAHVEIFDKGYGPRQIFRANPDVIHFHHLRPLFEFFKNPVQKQKIPVMFTAHGLHIHKYDDLKGIKDRTKRVCRSVLEKYLLKKINKVITVSREDELFLKTNYGLKNTVYITYGINVEAITKIPLSKNKLRKQLDSPLDAFIFLTVARFDYQKGHDILIQAVNIGQRLFRENNVTFLLVGDGEELAARKKQAEDYGLTDLVRFTGARDDSYALMKASDLFILPSRWEGLPISLIEASFCMMPIVASDTYGNREIVADGNSGFLFDKGDPEDLCKVLLSIIDEKILNRSSPASYTQAFRNKYDISTAVINLKKLYEELIAQ